MIDKIKLRYFNKIYLLSLFILVIFFAHVFCIEQTYSLSFYGRGGIGYGKVIDTNAKFISSEPENINTEYPITYSNSQSINFAVGLDMGLLPLKIEIMKIFESLDLIKNSTDSVFSPSMSSTKLDGYITSVYFTPLLSWFLAYPYLSFGLGAGDFTSGNMKGNSNVMTYGLGLIFSTTSNMQIEVGYHAIRSLHKVKYENAKILHAGSTVNGSLSIPYLSHSLRIGLIFHT
ncbi:hypothetical protein GUI12_04355 [Anaplasmataceae bacterium AB001_6]|nr:hypothetical protein GUI12_04355 [Anaplasmataceae bacterium AB001_6]